MKPELLFFFLSQRYDVETGEVSKVMECAFPFFVICPDEPQSRTTLCHCSRSQRIYICNGLCVVRLTARRAEHYMLFWFLPVNVNASSAGWGEEVLHRVPKMSTLRSFFPEKERRSPQ